LVFGFIASGQVLQVVAVTAAALVSLAAAFPARGLGRRLAIMDHPRDYSSHTEAVPRTGGLAIWLGVLAGMVCTIRPCPTFLVAVGITLPILLISFVDDLLALPPLPRMFVHLVTAGAAVWLIGLPPLELGLPYVRVSIPPLVSLPLAVLLVAGFANFFNFMDGINGAAASQGILGGLTLSVLLLWSGAGVEALIAAAVAGGCLGFLPHNYPKARLFMGDVGSVGIGFALMMLAFAGARHTCIPPIAFLLPVGVFTYDALFTLTKRAVSRKKVTQPHREHHYQLLIRCGWSHVRVTMLQLVLMLLWCAGALLYAWGDDAIRLAVLVGLLSIMGVYSLLVHRYFRKHGPADTPEEVRPHPPGPAAPEEAAD
jgi:UDP-N-acetylmuramyl pentapeptide phosphotransferase/UDP-N-acetylglucosamine-1-phosphate transferase